MDWSYQVLLAGGGQGALHHTLAATTGSFAASLRAANGKISRRLNPGGGSFSISAFAHLCHGFTLSAELPLYVISGYSGAVIRALRFPVGYGTVPLSAQTPGLLALRRLAASIGALSFTGGTAALHLIVAYFAPLAGSIALAGKTPAFRLARRLAGSAAAFNAHLQLAAGRAVRRITADRGDLASDGQPSAPATLRRLNAACGAFAAAGQATSGGEPHFSGRARTLGISIGF
jgi:hypothetical protein